MNKIKMKWSDPVMNQNSDCSFTRHTFGMSGAICAFYYIFSGMLFSSGNIEKIIGMVALLMLSLVLFNGAVKLIEGRKLIKNLSILESSVVLETLFFIKVEINFLSLKVLERKDKAWVIKKPHFYNTMKPGLTIHLNDGRYFRVSPHMECIDELKATLEKIIEENKGEAS